MDDKCVVLPDGSAFAVFSMPLPDSHWIYGDKRYEDGDGFEPPPMPFRMGTDNPQRAEMAEMVRIAARYAVRAATMKGAEPDFDPDALVQNMVVAFLGYFTPDGLSEDSWANPPDFNNEAKSEQETK